LAVQQNNQPSGCIAFSHDLVTCAKTANHVRGDPIHKATRHASERERPDKSAFCIEDVDGF